MNIYAVVASFLVAFVYIIFIRLLDVFEREPLKYTLLCFFLGMIFLYLLWPLHLIFPFVDEIQNGNSFGERFYFHLTAVAWLEEIVKIIPLLIMLRFKKAVNESFDYLKYASIGALGFATIETSSILIIMEFILLKEGLFILQYCTCLLLQLLDICYS